MPTFDANIQRSDAAALIPEQVTREIWSGTREASAFLSSARQLPNMARGQLRIPVLAGLPTAYVVGGTNSTAEESDVALRETTEVSWQNKYINAEEIACIVPIPRNVIDDSDYPIWEQLMPLIGEAMGKTVDGAAFVGTNRHQNWPVDIKTAAVAAGRSVSAASFGLSTKYYDAILGENGLFALVETQGLMVTASVAHPTMKGKLRSVKDSTGNPLLMTNMNQKAGYMLDGADTYFCNNGGFDSADALMFAGDWNQVVYSFRTDADFEIMKEGVIQDAAGNIIYNLGQQRMFALIIWFRWGWQVPNPPKRLSPTESTRYPIAVLTA